jgi:tetratricopeptide (TPR) repeat protein
MLYGYGEPFRRCYVQALCCSVISRLYHRIIHILHKASLKNQSIGEHRIVRYLVYFLSGEMVTLTGGSAPRPLNMRTTKPDAQKVIVLETKTSRPPVSRFQRQTPAPVIEQTHVEVEKIENHIQLLNESDFCQQLLSDGYVQSFVDFYHLTHRADPHSTEKAVTSTVAELTFIRDNLVTAETSRRQGNTANVYGAYGRLADLYTRAMDWRTSIFFHEKCLEVSQLTADARAEMTANHSLGIVHQKMSEFETAQKYHEKHEEVAKLYDVVEEVVTANVELYKVYTVIARRLEAEDRFTEALQFYEACLESAKKSYDKKAEGEANGKIGSLLLSKADLSNAARSIPYLLEQSQIAQEMGNAEGKCNACSGLALAYDLLGQADKALVQLSAVQTISEQTGDAVLQSKACRALGTLYSKVGKLEQALEALKKHYQLVNAAFVRDNSCSQNDFCSSSGVAAKIYDEISNSRSPESSGAVPVSIKDLDLARGYVGIAKGNFLMGNYLISIQSDLTAILDWKLTRSELPACEDTRLLPTQDKAKPHDYACSLSISVAAAE